MPPNRTTKVVIIGAGKIGQAIAYLLRQASSVEIETWDKDVTKVPHQKSLEEIVPSADIVFFCLPSWTLRSALEECGPYIRPASIVVSVSKGLEAKTCFTADQVLQDVLPRQPIALLLGPMLADEVMQGLKGVATIATRDSRVARRLATLFQDTELRVEAWKNIREAALASVLKNTYALAIGCVDGIEWGGNQKGWLAARALVEMRLVMNALKGNPSVIDTAAGTADFLATAMSPYSRNRQVGEELMRTGTTQSQSEGLVSFSSLCVLLKGKVKSFPILSVLEKIIIKHAYQKAPELFERV